MNGPSQPSRRQLLQWFASAPFLPLGAIASATVLPGCKQTGFSPEQMQDPIINLKNATFNAMPAPSLSAPADMATTAVGSSITIGWEGGSSTTFKLGYKSFFKTGAMVPNGNGGTILAGGYVNINNQPIIDTSVAGKERQFFSDSPDGTSLLTVAGVDAAKLNVQGNPVFAVVQFEYTTRNQAANNTDTTTDPNWATNPNNMYGKLPSPIAVLTLDQNPKTGQLTLVKYHNVDTSKVNGLWITCGASLSPWGTHLSSEEYEPDAFDQGVLGNSLATLKAFSKNLYGNETTANPYNYGHLPEVTVNPDGTGNIKKHYCLGRISHELIQVMPDNRTALMGDDFTNGGLFMFVADVEKDLSAGTLYVAKYTNLLNATTTANISWIKLGNASSAEIEALIKSGIKPTDIIDSVTTDPQNTSFTKVFLNKKAVWLRAKPDQEKAAAFLETHRYAALKGGSMAFTKMEGTTVNIKDKKAYSAISAIRDCMVQNGDGWNNANNVTFQNAIQAGGVLEHTLASAQKDSEGNLINSDWVPTSSQFIPALIGEDMAAADGLGNTANPDKVANPDNLKFSEKMRTLFIGEDSSKHVNNFLWAYNVDTKQLSRILSAPAGAESTGLQAVDSINDWIYITSNFQHPGDWEPVHSKVQSTLDPLIRKNWNDRYSASVGYLTADPIAPSIIKK